MEIRDAVIEDWTSIWPFFAAIVEDQETYPYDPGMTSQQARELWFGGVLDRTIVALVDGRIVGTAKMGANRAGPGDHIATGSFMVDTSCRSMGIGRRLGEELIAWAARAGFYGIQFNAVVETNEAAVHLWRSLGFQSVGVVPDTHRSPTHGLVGTHVMFRRL
ncbi:GNAT family N-acetyltransferase [Tsukamurella asaccharolytica]|uniref:GNAT family N-acetyltransferase n=1 Tax=Tsukamurella asaccharolytica TaxID=2592067 RepID=A0A5C5RCW3_9ACTN|nr:GNAT family N-acetyltransferase [Tsukamurella asaccharolytica]